MHAENSNLAYREITAVNDMADILFHLKNLEKVAAREKFTIKPELISHISSSFDNMSPSRQIEVLKIMGTMKC